LDTEGKWAITERAIQNTGQGRVTYVHGTYKWATTERDIQQYRTYFTGPRRKRIGPRRSSHHVDEGESR